MSGVGNAGGLAIFQRLDGPWSHSGHLESGVCRMDAHLDGSHAVVATEGHEPGSENGEVHVDSPYLCCFREARVQNFRSWARPPRG